MPAWRREYLVVEGRDVDVDVDRGDGDDDQGDQDHEDDGFDVHQLN